MKKSLCLLSFFLLLCNPLFSSEDNPKLIVESIGLNSQHIHRCASSFIAEIKQKHLGYTVSLDNVPSDKFIVVIARPLMAYGFAGCPHDQAMRKITMTKEQVLAQQKELAFHQPLLMTLSSAGYLPGERIEIRILDKYENKLSSVAFIPFPIRKKFKDGTAKISFECTSLENSMYRVYYTGFEEDEVVTMESQSGFEKMPPQELTINEKNGYGYSNAVVGMNGGISKFTVTRKNGDKVVFRLPWGSKFLPYMKGNLSYGDKI